MKIALFVLTLVVTAASFAGTRITAVSAPDFDARVFPVGKAPAAIAIADVNHDGKPDIIVANTDDQTLSVLLGDGKRHFAPAPGSPFPCGENPNDIAVADMNGDDNPDLVIANTGTPYLTILLGDGKGGFKPSPHSPFATESHPHVHGVAVADFTGDAKPDVATDSWGRDEILVIPGDGEGNLVLPGKPFHTGKRPYQRLRSADFNKDGNPDIVTTNLGGNTVSILLGDGKGGFRDAPGSSSPPEFFRGRSQSTTSTTMATSTWRSSRTIATFTIRNSLASRFCWAMARAASSRCEVRLFRWRAARALLAWRPATSTATDSTTSSSLARKTTNCSCSWARRTAHIKSPLATFRPAGRVSPSPTSMATAKTTSSIEQLLRHRDDPFPQVTQPREV